MKSKGWPGLIFFLLIFLTIASSGIVQGADDQALQKAKSHYDKGVKAAKAGKLADAEALFLKAIEEYPAFPGAWTDLGNIHATRKDFAKALDCYLKAKEAYIEVHQLEVKAATQQQWSNQDYTQANQTQSTMFKGGSTGFAHQSAQATKEDKMANQRTMATEEADIPAQLYLLLGTTRISLGQFAEAEQDLKAGIAKDSKNGPLHFQMAVVYFYRQLFTQSAEEARTAKKLGFALPADYVKALETKGQIKL